MSTVAISNNRTVTMNNTKVNKKATWIERFKNYILDNAEYFAASSALMWSTEMVQQQCRL